MAIALIEGLQERTAAGGRRDRHWLALKLGTELTILLDAAGHVLVTHDGIDLGRLRTEVANLADRLAAGERPRCKLRALQSAGFVRRRAVHVEVEVEVADTQFASTVWRLVETAAGGIADGVSGAGSALLEVGSSTGQIASRTAGGIADGVSGAGSALLTVGSTTGEIASKTAGRIVTYAIIKPAQGVRGFYRAIARKIFIAYLAAVVLLVLLLAIVVVWRLPTLFPTNY
jgi:hypothetical protein